MFILRILDILLSAKGGVMSSLLTINLCLVLVLHFIAPHKSSLLMYKENVEGSIFILLQTKQ